MLSGTAVIDGRLSGAGRVLFFAALALALAAPSQAQLVAFDGGFPPGPGLRSGFHTGPGGTTAVFDEELELDDVVAIRLLGRELVALDGLGGGLREIRFEPGETLLWNGSRGRVGLALTDRRVLGVRRGEAWRVRRLQVGEELLQRPQLGARVALLATSRRVLAFDGNWSEQDLGPGEQLQMASVGSGAALVVTDRRALALTPRSAGFLETRLHIHEQVELARAGAGLAEVTTSRRILLFSGRRGVWTEQRRSLH